MLIKSLISFVVVFTITCWAFTRLAVVNRKHRLAGTTVEEVYKADILLQKPGTREYYNPFDTQGLRALKDDIRFEGVGALRVLHAEIELQAAMVQWEAQEPNGMRKAQYSAPGVRMVARVKWEVSPAAADGDAGDVHLAFTRRFSNSQCEPLIHGPFEKTDDGTFTAVEITAYKSDLACNIGRCHTALVLALPLAGLIHGLLWAVVLHLRVKKQTAMRAAEPEAADGAFSFPAPPPLDDWRQACIIFCLFCGAACIPAFAMIAQQQLPSVVRTIIVSFTGAGLLAGAAMLLSVRRTVLWVRMNAETISCAKGRKEPLQWDTARWEDLVIGNPTASHTAGAAAAASGAATLLAGAVVPALASYVIISQRWMKILFPSRRAYTLTDQSCIQQVKECLKARHAAWDWT